MDKVKKIRLKPKAVKILKVIGTVVLVCLFLLIIYFYNIGQLKNLGYSDLASRNILLKFKKKYVLSIGENKTLNAAFESSDYDEDNLDNYSKIKYQNQKHLIKNINLLIKKKYSNSNISMILEHGNDNDVTAFTKRDKINYLEEFYSVSYAKLRNYDRYVSYSDESGEDEETVVLAVNLDMDKEDYKDPVVIDKYDEKVLVNKHRQLSKNYKPNDLVKINSKYATDKKQVAERVAVNAFINMYNAASKDGYGLVINSSYRSYNDQMEICDQYRQLYGDAYVSKYVALPGFSEHQTGLSFDIGSTNSKTFASSKEYSWMQDNAYKYGFIQRFPKGYESVTGFRAEPWHYRYVGKKIAKYMHDEKITYEEYYAMFLDKSSN